MIYGDNPSNDDAIVILIHAMAGHEIECYAPAPQTGYIITEEIL